MACLQNLIVEFFFVKQKSKTKTKQNKTKSLKFAVELLMKTWHENLEKQNTSQKLQKKNLQYNRLNNKLINRFNTGLAYSDFKSINDSFLTPVF